MLTIFIHFITQKIANRQLCRALVVYYCCWYTAVMFAVRTCRKHGRRYVTAVRTLSAEVLGELELDLKKKYDNTCGTHVKQNNVLCVHDTTYRGLFLFQIVTIYTDLNMMVVQILQHSHKIIAMCFKVDSHNREWKTTDNEKKENIKKKNV